MSRKTLSMNDALYDYLLSVSMRENEAQQALRRETAPLEMARMQISPEQGQFMALLARLLGAQKYLEIGTFTGYSTLCMAQAMPPNGTIVTCDIDEQWTELARKHWKLAGVQDRIELILATALETLPALLQQGQGESFDMAFIDADKHNQRQYFEYCLQLLRPGGLVLVDNVLWGGSVADPSDQNDDTVAIREFNAALHEDNRVDISMIPLGDGLTLARKIPR